MFLNLSYTMGVSKKLSFPSKLLETSLIEVYGDMRRRQHAFFFEDKYVAGPLPIDLPNKMISYSLTPTC